MLSTKNKVLELAGAAINGNGEMNVLHISHNDLDGYGCRIISTLIEKKFSGIHFDYLHIVPNQLANVLSEVLASDTKKYDLIIITDLAISQPVADICNTETETTIMVFDHHITQATNIPDHFVITRTLNDRLTCATELYYDEVKRHIVNPVVTEELSEFVAAVRYYDTNEFWLEEFADCKSAIIAPRLHIILKYLEPEEFVTYIEEYYDGVVATLGYDVPRYPWICQVVKYEFKSKETYVQSVIRRKSQFHFKFDIFKNGEVIHLDYSSVVIFSEKSNSMIANRILNDDSSIDICIIVTGNQVSLYTHKAHINMHEIATLFGGAGYRNAARFIVPPSNINAINTSHFISMCECAGGTEYLGDNGIDYGLFDSY